MKILFTGGGTGGHFYPIIAIAEEINLMVKENHLLRPELYYMSNDPYNDGLLFQNNIEFKKVGSGKIRKQKSIENLVKNFFDLFKIFFGSLHALWTLFIMYPDVVFGKGGYASFPALFAARILGIPVIIHESDSKPGKVSSWAGKFAQRIALSYPDAGQYFPKDRIAYTGNPIRHDVRESLSVGAHEYLNLDPTIPTILILGGSQGAQTINEIIMDILPDLVSKYQVIHQTGKKNIKVITETREVVLLGNSNKKRYRPYEYLNVLELRMSAGVADVIISRAGSTIFEIASWGKASIIIPIPEPTSHDQRSNAYAYARSGGAVVIEEKNLSPHVLLAEINRIVDNPAEKEKMEKSAKAFARTDSARLIAEQLLAIGLEHEK
ncbi:MAG: UDP-N-acetylglucosamine--N-acetylmuramyl-(pentapeptide) pyrophosphoryl-undecaprenol N-acetylglucosamine transferase [Patescibacteria group bacterium]